MTTFPRLYASKAGTLLSCPLRWYLDSRTAGFPNRQMESTAEAPSSVGSQVHKAIENWINSDQWRMPNCGELLAARFDEVASREPRNVGMIRRVQARLAPRGEQLSAYLAEDSKAQVHAEFELEDPADDLKGRVDVLSIGEEQVRVIDVKTGGAYRPGRPLPEEATAQLAVYSVLGRRRWGLPVTTAVFTLEEGIRAVALDDVQADSTVAHLLSERDRATQKAPEARPSAEHCYWCEHRAACPSHVAALRSGLMPDALEGRVVSISEVDAGLVNLSMEVGGEPVVVLRLDRSTVFGRTAGETVGVFRIQALEGQIGVWRGTQFSSVDVLGSEPPT